jgi:hypothetical protein
MMSHPASASRNSPSIARVAASVVLAASLCFSARAVTQSVFLDFTTNPGNGTSTHIYTASEQNSILTRIQGFYSSWDFSFSLTSPGGTFSSVTFNAPTDFNGNALVGGIAQDIDFRNLIKNDNARVNANGLLGGSGQPAATSTNFVNLTSFIGAHELGHLQGLRHADSWGPIGSGVSTTGNKNSMTPVYPGPVNATETGMHLMASPASVGQTLAQAVGPAFFGEREDVRLSFNQTGSTVAEQAGAHGSTATAQAITLPTLTVPNTLLAGTQNFGKTFDVKAVSVTGSISASGEADFYSFTAPAGLFEVQVIARTLPSPRTSGLDSQVSVFDSLGNFVNYFSTNATNDDEIEGTFDSQIIDLTLPTTGSYFMKVNGFSTSTGGYELYAYSFNVPEAGSCTAALFVAGFIASRRRRLPRASHAA